MNEPHNNAAGMFHGSPGEQPIPRVSTAVAIGEMVQRALEGGALSARRAPEDELLLRKTETVRRHDPESGESESIFELCGRTGLSVQQLLFWDLSRIQLFVQEAERRYREDETYFHHFQAPVPQSKV